MDIRTFVLEWRGHTGTTQKQLAEMAGLPQSTVSAVECKTNYAMTFITAIKLARAIGVSLDYLADLQIEDRK